MMNKHESRLEDKKLYYLRNQKREQAKARERARKKLENETPEEAVQRKEKHRSAQARYRAQNRVHLSVKSWQYRQTMAHKKALAADEEEYQRFMAIHDVDNPTS